MNLDLPFLDQQAAASPVRQSYAHARILHCTGDSGIRLAVIDVFYRFQRLCHRCGRIRNLAIWQYLSRTDRVAVANLPWRDPHHFRQLVQIHLRRKAGLGHAESTKCPCRRVIGIDCRTVDIYVLEIIGSGRMSTGPLEHRPAKGCVSAGI